MMIQVNASQVGLGTALLQNGKPVAFASKAPTETECWYANIDREMLAVVFRVERFWMYVYGRSWTIESDHKPLESISQKNLTDTPSHLQCMLLCLQGYDYTIHYYPSKKKPCQTHSLGSVHVLDPTSHWTSPSTMLTCPQRGRKHSSKLLWAILRCMFLLTCWSLVGLMTSRQFLTHYANTGNIMRPSPLKMALSYVEKPSSSLHQKGRGYYNNSTSSIKEPPKPSCLHVDVSSGQA